MKDYIGLKLIKAESMNRKDYNDFRGWRLPVDEDGSDEGFLVEYLNGGAANTEKYDGYVSWSPKEVFENAYTEIHKTFLRPENVKLEPYQERVLVEHDELIKKIEDLAKYLETHEDEMLYAQSDYMCGYAIILEKRIENWSK